MKNGQKTKKTKILTNNLEKLYRSGLDEIRFHLDLDDKILWDRINLAKNLNGLLEWKFL